MMSEAAKVGITLGVAAAAAIGIGWAASSKASSAQPPAPGPSGGGTTYNMLAGHRYTVTAIAHAPFTPASSAAVQSSLDAAAGAGVFKLASAVMMPGSNEAEFAVDVTAAITVKGSTLIAAVGAPAASSVFVADDGPSSGSGIAWIQSTTINPGDHVRASLAASDFTTIAASLGITQTGLVGWGALLTMPQIANVLASAQVNAWGPGDTLPSDWPAADAGAASEYHVDFTYGGTAPILVSALPLPLTVWIAKGISTPGPVKGGFGGHAAAIWLQAKPTTSIVKNDRIRLSIPPSGVQSYGFALQMNTNNPSTVVAALLADSRWIAFPNGGTVYAPGDSLPSDWPADEPDALNNWHVDVTVLGPGFTASQLDLAVPGTVIWRPILVF